MARRTELSEAAREALAADTRHVFACIYSRIESVEERPISGLVLGAVQSGKTTSMLAVSALALDNGFNVVVIVSGTRVSLWRQTLDRAVRDLDGWSRDRAFQRRQSRLWMPDIESLEASVLSPTAMFGEGPNRVARFLCEGRPLIAVVMKQADHLLALTATLQRSVRAAGRPIKMLVIDDEADDGSILSTSDRTSGGDPRLAKRIEGLWATGPSDSRIFHQKTQVAYLAYTATPQANLLQYDHNPLSPRDFVTCIRAPGVEGVAAERISATYSVPALAARYIGGSYFYPAPTSQFNPCVSLPTTQGLSTDDGDKASLQHVGGAIRAFIVASACRLLESRSSYTATRGRFYGSREKALECMPPIASMLLNPGSQVDSHFDGELLIRAWVHGESAPTATTASETAANGRPIIEWSRLSYLIEKERDSWHSWLEAYRQSAERLRLQPGCSEIVAPPDDWTLIERVISEEILPSVRVQVVNSSEAADAAPEFAPAEMPDGTWRLPDSLCTIFVAGNVMSRGLTLEGLSTTLFLRDPTTALADTQMQMQRWFGYRGRWLQYCRLFAFDDQLARFRQYNAADEALRAEILSFERQSSKGVSPQILGGRSFMPTGKVENLRRLPLAPGAAPFINGYWEGSGADPNLEIVRSLFANGEIEGVEVGGLPRGLLLKRKLLPLEAAACLDRMQFVLHDPRPSAEQHARWESLERTMFRQDGAPSLFRPDLPIQTRHSESKDVFPPTKCPYSIAAYLRLWHACIERAAHGLFPNDKPDCPWGHLSFDERRRRYPKFSIGIRFGRGDVASGTVVDEIGLELGKQWRIRSMDRNTDAAASQMVGTWGSRNPSDRNDDSYFGDQFFDYHRTGEVRVPRSTTIDDISWRAIGEDGLLLFHPVQSSCGQIRLAVGVCLPAGGPDQIGILRPIVS